MQWRTKSRKFSSSAHFRTENILMLDMSEVLQHQYAQLVNQLRYGTCLHDSKLSSKWIEIQQSSFKTIQLTVRRDLGKVAHRFHDSFDMIEVAFDDWAVSLRLHKTLRCLQLTESFRTSLNFKLIEGFQYPRWCLWWREVNETSSGHVDSRIESRSSLYVTNELKWAFEDMIVEDNDCSRRGGIVKVEAVLRFVKLLMHHPYLRTQISLWPSGRLASRRSSARLELSLKRLAGWVSWHQRVWAPNAENEMSVSRIFRNLDFRNFNFQKFYVHSIHQI